MQLLKWLFVFLAFAGLAFGQTQPKSQTQSKRAPESKQPSAGSVASSQLTVESVLTMVEAGLSEDLVVSRLRKEGKAFDLTPETMIRLKKAGATDGILKVMLDPNAELKPSIVQQAAPATPPQPSPAPVVIVPAIPAGVAVSTTNNPSGATPSAGAVASDTNDPLTPHDSGIWLYTKDRDGKPTMIVLERAAYQGAKTGGLFASAMTAGLKKMKMKAIIPGQRASIRVAEPTPVFYFYFDDKAAGLGKSYFGATSVSNPNQFALVKLEAKKSNRETIVGEIGALGASTGTHEKSMNPFKSERIRTGLYRVVPTAPLAEGEYCFLVSSGFGGMGPMASGASGAVDIFDFAVSLQ